MVVGFGVLFFGREEERRERRGLTSLHPMLSTQQRSVGTRGRNPLNLSMSSTFRCGTLGKKSLRGSETVLKSAIPNTSGTASGTPGKTSLRM